MILSVDISDLKAFGKQVARIAQDQPSKISKALMTAGYLVERESKMVTPVRTGRLRASIDTQQKTPYSVAIGPHTNYAIYVHYHTPYMTSGFYSAKARIESIMGIAMGESARSFKR
jgi:hypothetical protein